MTYIGFPILSLIYLIIFLFLYYSKKRINLFENKIVILMMFVNIIGLLLELGCYVVMAFLKIEYTIIGMFILKSYIVYICIFNFILTGYIFVLTSKNRNNNEYNMKAYFKNVILTFLPLTFFVVFIIYYFPLQCYSVYPKYYTYGLSTTSLLIDFIVLLPIWIIKCIKVFFDKRLHSINTRVGLLFFGILLSGITGSIVQFVDHSVLIITAVHSLVLTLIYFTIENPDMKLLDEVYHAKEISDNSNEEKTMFIYNMTNEIRQITKDIDISCDNILNVTGNKKIDQMHEIEKHASGFVIVIKRGISSA